MKVHPGRGDYPWPEFAADLERFEMPVILPAPGREGELRLWRPIGAEIPDERFQVRREAFDYIHRNFGGFEEHGIVTGPFYPPHLLRGVHHAVMETSPGREPDFARVIELCHFYLEP